MTCRHTPPRAFLAALALPGVFLLACGKEAPLGGIASVIPSERLRCDVPFATVEGLEYPMESSHRTSGIVDNEEDFCDLWSDVGPLNTPCDPSNVDFDREVVLVASGTGYPTGGYRVEVTCVQTGPTTGFLEVVSIVHAPGPGCLVPQVLTNPLAIVKVPRPVTSAKFGILRTIRRHACN